MIKISIELKTANKSFQDLIILSEILMPLSQSETYTKAEPSGPQKWRHHRSSLCHCLKGEVEIVRNTTFKNCAYDNASLSAGYESIAPPDDNLLTRVVVPRAFLRGLQFRGPKMRRQDRQALEALTLFRLYWVSIAIFSRHEFRFSRRP